MNSDYGYLPGGQSLDYVSSQFLRFDIYEDFPVKTIYPLYDADNDDHCWGVHLYKCRSQDMRHYMEWCASTFDGFEMDGMGRRFWFKEEKHRTMFLLRWS